jgi:Ser/Thr protein kinase RdoA (MazF antagonist)
MSSGFAELSHQAQIAHVIELARTVLRDYPFEVKLIELINFEFNATFKILTSEDEKYALRININSERTDENLQGEIALVQFLADKSTVILPRPIASRDNHFALTIYSSFMERNLAVILYSWLEGEELGDVPSEDALGKLGAAMARMHKATEGFVLPAGAQLPTLRDFLWGTKDVVFTAGSPVKVEEKALLSRAKEAIEKIIDDLYSENSAIAIHADLHGWNVMKCGDEISVFDFDDSGIGLKVQDLATSLYYLDTPEQDAALINGYRSVSELPSYSELQMNGLLLQRRIILLNYLFETTNIEHRQMAPKYLEETIRRARVFLDQ